LYATPSKYSKLKGHEKISKVVEFLLFRLVESLIYWVERVNDFKREENSFELLN